MWDRAISRVTLVAPAEGVLSRVHTTLQSLSSHTAASLISQIIPFSPRFPILLALLAW